MQIYIFLLTESVNKNYFFVNAYFVNTFKSKLQISFIGLILKQIYVKIVEEKVEVFSKNKKDLTLL
jgi:hypothetical protein